MTLRKSSSTKAREENQNLRRRGGLAEHLKVWLQFLAFAMILGVVAYVEYVDDIARELGYESSDDR